MILSGYGITIEVRRGYLFVKDGFGRDIRQMAFHKIDRIKWVIILGHSGFITLGALKWLHELETKIIHIGWRGEIYYTSTPDREDIFLRRKQYKAKENETGVNITRYLISERLKEQQAGLIKYFPGAVCVYEKKTYNSSDFIQGLLSNLGRAVTIPEILGLEALAGYVYWNEIKSVPVQFKKTDLSKVPEHWKVFGLRVALPHTKSHKNAINPANATLNYLLSLLFAETKLMILQAVSNYIKNVAIYLGIGRMRWLCLKYVKLQGKNLPADRPAVIRFMRQRDVLRRI